MALDVPMLCCVTVDLPPSHAAVTRPPGPRARHDHSTTLWPPRLSWAAVIGNATMLEEVTRRLGRVCVSTECAQPRATPALVRTAPTSRHSRPRTWPCPARGPGGRGDSWTTGRRTRSRRAPRRSRSAPRHPRQLSAVNAEATTPAHPQAARPPQHTAGAGQLHTLPSVPARRRPARPRATRPSHRGLSCHMQGRGHRGEDQPTQLPTLRSRRSSKPRRN